MTKVSNQILLRVYIVCAIMLLFAGGIMYRVVKLQFFEKELWQEYVEEQRIYYKKVVAGRGNIIADDGSTILATSLPFFKLSIDPSLIKKEGVSDFDAQLDTLANKLEEGYGSEQRTASYFKDKIIEAMEEKDRHLYLYNKTVNLRQYKEAKKWPIFRNSMYEGGLIGERINNKRFYPFGDLARITLGVLRNDTLGAKGIEYSFNQELRGRDGRHLVEKIAGGYEIPVGDFSETGSVEGSDVVTSLNVEIQDITESALMRSMKKHEAKFGVAMVMEVKTGEIKAIANLNRSKNGQNYYDNYNYAVADAVEPGSTIKLASMMALLEDGAVNIKDSIDTGKGFAQFYDITIRDHIGMGKISFADAFHHSSNVAIARKINDTYKEDPGKFISRLNQFHLTSTVNEQIKGEAKPYIPRPGERAEWKGTTLPSMSIGYNLKVAPLQMLTLYNAIANDGKMVAPLFVKEIRNDSKVIAKYSPKVIKERICSPYTLETMQSLLEGVVEKGTAKNIKTGQYKIAGKTGTAKVVVEGSYRAGYYRASFAGYFPADNPKYTILVMVEEPSTGSIYGSSVAAPVFREISDQVYSLDPELGRKPTPAQGASEGDYPLTRIINQENAEDVYNQLDIPTPDLVEGVYVKAVRKKDKVEYRPITLRPGVMPDVKGMSARDATTLLESRMLKVRRVGHGKVVKQSLKAGLAVEDGTTITLELK